VTPDSPGGRFAALILIFGFAQVVYVPFVNPDVLKHRSKFKRGTEAWDLAWLPIFLASFLAIPAVAAYQARTGLAPMPVWAVVTAWLLFFLGLGLFVRAMGENPFFEKTVRIQRERDHHVIETGPYRFVRHPGYVGLTLWIAAFPPLLGSSWAAVPAGVVVGLVVFRTFMEDRTLHVKLAGYAGYAERVRYRLVPGLW
jgi:protein-S-isoprenylcysteine O-methyltransferase Ste14